MKQVEAYRCQLGLDLGNALLAKVDWAPRLWAVDKDSRRHDAAVRQLSAPQGAGVGSARPARAADSGVKNRESNRAHARRSDRRFTSGNRKHI